MLLTSRDRTANVEQKNIMIKNGNADIDIDYTDHENPKQHPKEPHRHDWNGYNSGPAY